MSKSFDEICNTVLGEDINVALWENVPANVQTVVQDLFKNHGSNPEFMKYLDLEKKKLEAAQKTPATPNQPNQPQNNQNTANKTTTTPTTPTNTTQPSQPTTPVK